MKAWQFGVVLLIVSVLLSFGIYYDAKTSNVLPWMVIFADLLMFLFGLILIKWGNK